LVIAIAVLASTIVCAIQALRAARLLVSALWLAGTSALIALLLYMLGVHEVAVVELSVGAGLVTILFVFAISVAGEETIDVRTFVPKPLAIGLVAVAVLLMAWLILGQPGMPAALPAAESSPATFSDVLWQQRGPDVLLQVVMIFTGVLGMLGLLAHGQAATEDGRRKTTEPTSVLISNGHHNGHQTEDTSVTVLNPKSTIENPKSEGVAQ
jgi:NADH:ubiquinone oxidoreductase subunit 6 (subunit J)